MSNALWVRYTHTKFLASEAGTKEDLHSAHRQNESYRTNVIHPRDAYSRHSEIEIASFGTD
jgi:hypothetical protein